jgi:hypothetical protein
MVATFSEVMSCSTSNTKHSLLCLAVLAHATDALRAILEYITANKADRTKDITADFTVGADHTALWEAVHHQNWAAAGLLIAAGADLTKAQMNARCPFIEALFVLKSVAEPLTSWVIKDAHGKELQVANELILRKRWSAELAPDDNGEYLEKRLDPLDMNIAQKVADWARVYRAGSTVIIVPPETQARIDAPPPVPEAKAAPAEVCEEDNCVSTEGVHICNGCGKIFCVDHLDAKEHDCPGNS